MDKYRFQARAATMTIFLNNLTGLGERPCRVESDKTSTEAFLLAL